MAYVHSSSDGVIKPKVATKEELDFLHSRVDVKDTERLVEAAKKNIPTTMPKYTDEAYKKRCAEIQANLAQTLKRKQRM